MLKQYRQNENLTVRVLSSLMLYLDDLLNPDMSVGQKASSADAAVILIDAVLNNISETIPSNVRDPVENIFSKIIYAIRINNREEIVRCKAAISKMISMTN